MASYSEILFGRVLLKNRLATFAQVTDCLKRARGQTLGEIMIQQGIISPEQARQAQRAQALMQFMRAEKLFARILVDERIVDVATLRKAFEYQERQRYKVRLAQILQERGLLTTDQIERVVDRQLMLLADETTQIEEGGLEAALSGDPHKARQTPIDGMVKIASAEDLDNSSLKRALGPRGLLDAKPIQRTMPVMVAPVVEDTREQSTPVHKRTLMMDSRRVPRDKPVERPPPPPLSDDDLVGHTLASRYRILEQVGEGGMGTVYRAEHCLMEKIVAVKILHPSLVSSSASLERFRREIRATSRFQHKNVIQIYDAGEGEGGLFYMAMEFAEGETLEQIIQRDGAMELDRLLPFFRQTLRALGEAHKKNIVHRDMKSGNIMVTLDKDGTELVKVMDFGIAKIAFEEQEAPNPGGLYKTQEGIVTGTPQYMSPEQASGERVDHRSDLYSLGVILFELLTGELPFKSDTPMGFLGKHIVEPPPTPTSVAGKPIPVVLEEITLKLLEKKPEDRYQTADDVLVDLDLKCSGEGLSVVSSSMAAAPAGDGSASYARTIPVQPVPTVDEVPPTTKVLPVLTPKSDDDQRKTQLILIAVLSGFLLLVISVSTTLVLIAGGKEREVAQATIDEAEGLVERDPDRAIELLEPVVAEFPDDTRAKEVLDKARGLVQKREQRIRDAIREAQEGDKYAGIFEDTRSVQAGKRAVKFYRRALLHHPKPDEVRGKLEDLERRLTRPPDAEDLLWKINAALLKGKLDEAERLMEQAEAEVGPDDKKLLSLRALLDAERLLQRAREARDANRLGEALTHYQRVVATHPKPQEVEDAKSEIKKLQAKIDLARRREAVDRHLATGLQAALNLEVTRSERALSEARKSAASAGIEQDPRLAERKAALKVLSQFAPDWGGQRKELGRLKQDVDASPKQARAVRTRLRELRRRVARVGEAALKSGLTKRLEEDIRQADDLTKALEEARKKAKSKKLMQFERKLEMVKATLTGERETYVLVHDRLSVVRNLRYLPAYRQNECSKKDRAWIKKQVSFWTRRRSVWRELGRSMAAIPGGRWKSPTTNTSHDLPKVYYAGIKEVTCAEWKKFVDATGRSAPPEFPGPLNVPVHNIRLKDARDYCKWRSRNANRVQFRLPTEGEWERAARGPEKTRFPWGKVYQPHYAKKVYGAVGLSSLQRVGTTRLDRNGWGLYDVVGNAAEIVDGPKRRGKAVYLGGSINTFRHDAGAGARKVVPRGDEQTRFVGFRVFAVER